MEKKTRFLMQLYDCLEGYSGVQQETQTLFSSLLDSSFVQCDGLMMMNHPLAIQRLSKGISKNQLNLLSIANQGAIKRLSDFIVSYTVEDDSNEHWPSYWRLALLPLRLLLLNSKTNLGVSIPLEYFAVQGFENFLWDLFFSKISAVNFKKIMGVSFRTLRYPITLMHLAGHYGFTYPQIDTRGYAVFLAQTPFPGRVAKETQLVIRYHDAIPVFAPHLIKIPKYHQLFHYNALKSNAKNAIFVCSSNATRNDLLCLFPHVEERSCVIHDCVSQSYFEEKKSNHGLIDVITSRLNDIDNRLSDAVLKLPPDFPYLLMVSTIEPRKNHLRLIHAWEMLRSVMNKNIKLIFVGKIGWRCHAILNVMKPWQLRGELFHLQNVPTSELRLLYNEASCVVCPSMLEGFDLTGIEAMLCGGRVAASDIPVHREVYGEAAMYFNPYSVADQADVIKSIVSSQNEVFARELSARGLGWAPRYQPDKIIPQWEQFFKNIKQKRL